MRRHAAPLKRFGRALKGLACLGTEGPLGSRSHQTWMRFAVDGLSFIVVVCRTLYVASG